jgi:Uma2 family endonuclease
MGATTLLSLEEFHRLPKETGKKELLDGELIVTRSRTMFRHTKVIRGFYDVLRPFEGTSGLGEVYVEAEYRLGPRTLLRPDVSITHPDHPVESDDLIGAPALAIEVVSPSNTAEEMNRKMKYYLANGGIEVWVVYPETRSVWLFRPGRAEEFSGSLRSALIPGLEIDLERLLS